MKSLTQITIPNDFFCPPGGGICQNARTLFGIDVNTGGPATIGLVITTLLPNILILAGVIFFLLILGGGFMMISGAGKESSPQDKAKAQGAITYGVIGFLLVVSAYFILQIVGVITGINFITPPNL